MYGGQMDGIKGQVARIAEAMAARELARVVQPRPAEIKRIDVTPERKSRNKIVSAGMARKIVPVIDTLWDADKLTATEYDLLAYYRAQAGQAEDDVAVASVLAPEKMMGGGGSGHPIGGYIPANLLWTPAIAETARIERDLGSLRAIAQAVAVADMTLSQWCIKTYGGRERYDDRGRFVAMVPIAEKRHMPIALKELKFAARRITR